MHAVPLDVDRATPCNAYCGEGWHVDITYGTARRARRFGSIADHLRWMFTNLGGLEVLAIVPAPEAPPLQARYPDPSTARLLARVGEPLEAWQAFRVTYRVRTPDAGGGGA